MSRRFSHADVARTQRVMQALLPEGVTVSTSVVRDGWYLSITICGKQTCKPYELSGSLNDKHLLFIAETWATGDHVAPATAGDVAETNLKAVTAPTIGTRQDFTAWCRNAKRGDKVVYFRGELSNFRFEAPRRVVVLQGLADKAKRSKPRPLSESMELASLQEKMDLLEAVNKLHTAAVIELVQHRLADGTGATYYAVKRN